MSLEGLRAWIGEVERKLGKRTRVFLALAVIAIGLGGAAIYLAIDAREGSVSKEDVQELQRELEARIDAAAAGEATVPVEPLEPPPAGGTAPAPEPEPEPGSDGGDGGSGGTGGVGAGGASADGKNSSSDDAARDARIQKLLEQTQEENAQAEEEQAGADSDTK